MDNNLEGKWKCKSAFLAGDTFKFKNLSITVKGNTYSSIVNNQKESGELQIHPDTDPKQVDVFSSSGPNKGKTMPAIFKVNGKSLLVCYNIMGNIRPSEFSSTKSNGFLLLKLQKVPKFLSWF